MRVITLRYFDGCPNWRVAEERLRAALADLGEAGFRLVRERVETPEDAERLSFRGSPTVLIDGRDPFPGGEVGLSCRVYRTEAGAEGAPSVEQLRRALAG
jgi:hypothetical protein